ncbi:glycosyltransferase family 2 protein [Sinorhizobium terangae]|uniref:glycosyltransferase family 2 protein n=1 Tax=Sinorhizobium terangae TaxID=110322 RepID=UPI0024B04765|nr:glycosyltransferase family 2 protein [Sinorhizobium terangae]WFU50228.1 glycosyltransferase family 2 protein [Sinorhizobium terangae]
MVIPTYNRTSLLRRALNSVAQQTHLPAEVIIVDDCSESAVLEDVKSIILDFSPRINIRLIVNNRNSGANHARNKGIFAATNRYIAFLDSDDLWFPEKLERQLEEIGKAEAMSNKPVLSATGRYRVDDQGEIIARQFGGHVLNSEKIRRSNFIGTLSSVVVEAAVARQVRGFNEALPASQDWDFFIRLSEHVQYVGVAEPLCVYVDHSRERITLDYRKKLRGHTSIYKTHVGPVMTATNAIRTELLRNIAEDYQELGNKYKTASFYAGALASGIRVSRSVQRLIACALDAYFRVFSPPPLRLRRYQRYRRSMDKLLKDETTRAIITRDRSVIQRLMA